MYHRRRGKTFCLKYIYQGRIPICVIAVMVAAIRVQTAVVITDATAVRSRGC